MLKVNRQSDLNPNKNNIIADVILPHPLLWLGLLIIVSIIIRVYGVGDFHLYHDEAMNVAIAKAGSLAETIQFSHYETHPPLGSMLYHYWVKLSEEPAFLRSLSLLFGSATILLYYYIGCRIKDEWCGFCAAGLIAFSQACIVQSYIMRNYMILLFFLSAAYYCYLHWQSKHSTTNLLLYGLFGICACLTHFSALFALFCIAAAELLIFRSAATIAKQLQWIIINLSIAVIGMAIYVLWNPTMLQMHQDVQQHMVHISYLQLLASGLLYPISLFAYIAPNLYLGFLCGFLLPLALMFRVKHLRSYIALGGFALFFGAVLYASGLYPEAASRHSIWIIPFIIPAAAILLSYMLRHKRGYQAFAFILLGCIAYSPSARLVDNSEYALTEPEWNKVMQSLSMLKAEDLLISERGEAFLIAPPSRNLYRDLVSDDITYPGTKQASATVTVPYENAQLMFRRFYMNYDSETLVALLKSAAEKGTLDKVNTLYFFMLSTSKNMADNLEKCEALDKEIITLTDSKNVSARLLKVSKQALFEQFIAPDGKAHRCIDNRAQTN